jgi:hypothetical protein
MANTLRSWSASRRLRAVCVPQTRVFNHPLLASAISFRDMPLVCLAYYVQKHGEFFDVGGLTFPREYVLRE